MGTILLMIGWISMGFTPLNITPTTEVYQKGCSQFRQGCLMMYKSVKEQKDIMKPSDILAWSHYRFQPIGNLPVDTWTVPKTDEERYNWSAAALVETEMMYVFEEVHEALGTQYQFDEFLEVGSTIGTITLYHADTKGISTVAENYFSNQLKNYASGGHMVGVLLEI